MGGSFGFNSHGNQVPIQDNYDNINAHLYWAVIF